MDNVQLKTHAELMAQAQLLLEARIVETRAQWAADALVEELAQGSTRPADASRAAAQGSTTRELQPSAKIAHDAADPRRRFRRAQAAKRAQADKRKIGGPYPSVTALEHGVDQWSVARAAGRDAFAVDFNVEPIVRAPRMDEARRPEPVAGGQGAVAIPMSPPLAAFRRSAKGQTRRGEGLPHAHPI